MNLYINRGRFGEFVRSVVEAENQRKKDEIEKEDDMKLWIMYVHNISLSSFSGTPMNESFNDWKNRVCMPANAKIKKNSDAELDENGVKSILDKLFPE